MSHKSWNKIFADNIKCLSINMIQSICSKYLGIICKNNEAFIPTLKWNKTYIFIRYNTLQLHIYFTIANSTHACFLYLSLVW